MLEFVKVKDADKEFLLRLRKLTMTEHLEKAGLFLSDEDHMKRVQFHFESSYIITQLDQKIGLLKYVETEKYVEILQLQILPNFQGRGIGKQAIDFLITKEKDLKLKVLKENPARYLYERIGFNIINEDPYEFHMKFIS